MTWKQPIPTSFGLESDPPADTMLTLLLRSAAEVERTVEIAEGQFVKLQRGDAIYGRFVYAKKLGLKRNESQRCDRILSRLQKLHNRINIRTLNKCTIVSIKNYDSLVEMNKDLNIRQTTDKQQINTYKIVKNEKNVKSNRISTDTRANADTFLANFNKQTLDRDLIKWENIRKRNVANGKLGGRPRKANNPEKPSKPSGYFGNPKNLVSVNGNVNVNVTDKKKAILSVKDEDTVPFKPKAIETSKVNTDSQELKKSEKSTASSPIPSLHAWDLPVKDDPALWDRLTNYSNEIRSGRNE